VGVAVKLDTSFSVGISCVAWWYYFQSRVASGVIIICLRKCGCDANFSVYGPVLCGSLQEKFNTLLDYCVYKKAYTQSTMSDSCHVRFMRFFEFVMSGGMAAVQNINTQI